VLLAMLTASISAFAGSPQIGVLDPLCTPINGFPTHYDFAVTNVGANGSVQLPSFSPNSNGGGSFSFCNLTNQYWTHVSWDIPNVFSAPAQVYDSRSANNPTDPAVQCDPGSGSTQAFLYCMVTVTSTDIKMSFFGAAGDGDNNLDDFIGGLVTGLGILPFHTMEVSLNSNYCVRNCPDGGNWFDSTGQPLTNLKFNGTVNSTPEPSSWLLLASAATLFIGGVRKKASQARI
ncbi:MAG: PEP-CTERM sorting domain-containing protein, partial [Terriglobales bacterium]